MSRIARKPKAEPAVLPAPFAAWFAGRGWTPRPHQLELLAKARAGRSTLLIAPTGAGKTLAGFLPTLAALHERPAVNRPEGRGVHTLYVSPLKALAVDIARNLETPVREMGLRVAIETRTGDTPVHKRQRQKLKPPDILLTTPEQVALLLSAKDAPRFFADLDTIILDELHALVTSKRGDIEVTLRDGREVRGVVRDPDGAPVAGAVVSAAGPGRGRRRQQQRHQERQGAAGGVGELHASLLFFAAT